MPGSQSCSAAACWIGPGALQSGAGYGETTEKHAAET
jgi:hypothetical protein